MKKSIRISIFYKYFINEILIRNLKIEYILKVFVYMLWLDRYKLKGEKFKNKVDADGYLLEEF